MPSPKSKPKLRSDHTRFAYDAIGTSWLIDIYSPVKDEQSLLQQILSRVEVYEAVYSRFRSDSLVTRISESSGTYTFPEDFLRLHDLYRELYDLTDGLFTPFIGNVMEDAGYDANYSLIPKQISSPKPWDDLMFFTDKKLRITEPVMLDFGAGGKGYLVDIVGELLVEYGVDSYCIDAGGDMLIKGHPSRVGLEHPSDNTKVIGVALVDSASLCGSATNRRKWGHLHHIINPKSLLPVDNILATWVVAETGLMADSLATALFFTDPAILGKKYDFEYLIVYSDYSYKKSSTLNAEIFLDA